MPSTTLLLRVDGERIYGAFRAPVFSVRSGEVVRLQYLENTYDAGASREQIFADMRQSHHTSGFQLFVSCAVVEAANHRRGLAEVFHRQTTTEWLQRQCGVDAAEAMRMLTGVPVDPSLPVRAVAGTPRMLLGLLAALQQPADLLVLRTCGWCDPCGVRSVLRLLFERLGDRGAVYVTSPTDWEFDEFRFATTVSMVRSEDLIPNRVAG